jgi:hypothetical protein
MTQQEIVKEFRKYSAAQQAALISRLSRVMQEKLESENGDKQNKQAERAAAIERLRGIGKVEGKPPLTDKEIKEDYTNYLMEKYS